MPEPFSLLRFVEEAPMAEWAQVERRAAEETEFAKQAARNGVAEIDHFYPELYQSSGVASFTNTLGSYLIPDLLTSQRVVVDLYDWPSPESLIEIYGVDLPFLLALRDAKLVTVCANLPVERYRAHSWLFPLLADSRTLFRSIRTPAFVAAVDPDFPRRVFERQTHMQRYFESLSMVEVDRLCGVVKADHPPTDAPSLASILAHWLERLASFEPDLATVIGDGFEREVVDRTPELMRLQRLVVSPYTAALGGAMKIGRSRWVMLFGEEGLEEAILEGTVRFQSLNSYFSEAQLNLDALDLTSKDLWNTIRHSDRKRLLERLGDAERKADLLAIEEGIRIGLLGGGNQDPTRESVKAYVEKLEGEVETLRRLSDLLGIAASTAFGFLHESVLAGVSVATGFFSSKYLLGDRIRRLTEGVLRKLRVVRVLGKCDK
jgi:hypothetical protein